MNVRDKVIDRCVLVARNLIHMPKGKSRHFSFIIRKNNIVSIGWNNQLKTHPLAFRYNYSYCKIHSELAAILNFDDFENVHRYEMLNLRFNTGELDNSKPCPKCQNMLKCHGFSSVVYSTNEGFKRVRL